MRHGCKTLVFDSLWNWPEKRCNDGGGWEYDSVIVQLYLKFRRDIGWLSQNQLEMHLNGTRHPGQEVTSFTPCVLSSQRSWCTGLQNVENDIDHSPGIWITGAPADPGKNGPHPHTALNRCGWHDRTFSINVDSNLPSACFWEDAVTRDFKI